MSASIEDTASVVARLESCPVQLAKLTEGLGRDRLQSPTAAEPWSANDMLAHLRANADVWGKTIARMVREDHPTIRYVSPRGFIRKSGYLDLDFHASLAAFAVQRQALVAQLRPPRPQLVPRRHLHRHHARQGGHRPRLRPAHRPARIGPPPAVRSAPSATLTVPTDRADTA